MNGEIYQKLLGVQSKLNAPKGQYNKFGKYSYRSAEDILEAVKPLLKEAGATIVVGDEIAEVAGRVYVKATAAFVYGDGQITVSAFAREEEERKGMDAAQVTGSASSYARKYALNGLLLIDDCKDPDTRDNREEKPEQKPAPEESRTLTPDEVAACDKWAAGMHPKALDEALKAMGKTSTFDLKLSDKRAFMEAVKAAAKRLNEEEEAAKKGAGK